MRGFTLIESIIYLALFSIIMSGILSGFWALTASADRSETRTLLETEGNFLLAKVTYNIANAQEIQEPGNNASSAEISLTTFPNTPVLIYVADGVMVRTEKTSPIPLSTNSVTVSSLSFEQKDSGEAGLESIQTSFQLSATTNDGQVLSEDFSSTTYISS